jgi:hypothetical protein
MIGSTKGVAYDETDEAAEPEEARSEAWRTRHVNSELSCAPWCDRSAVTSTWSMPPTEIAQWPIPPS